MEMDNQSWLGLVGIVIIIFQAIQVMQQRQHNIYVKWQNEKISNAMTEIGKIWVRINTHGHTVECNENDCKIKTTGIKL